MTAIEGRRGVLPKKGLVECGNGREMSEVEAGGGIQIL